jgi:hypothetical protein
MRAWLPVATGFLTTSLALIATGCGPPIDLSTGLQVDAVSTGWVDAGNVEGKKKIVPDISFKLKNASGQKLTMLEVNAQFRRVDGEDEWGNGFVRAAGSSGLAPGAVTNAITLRSQLGYVGTNRAPRCSTTRISSTPRSFSLQNMDRRTGPGSASTRSLVECTRLIVPAICP